MQKELDLHVVFAGAVEDQRYYEELQNFVSACGLEKNVEFIGFASNLKEYYRVSHLLILASLEEGTPNVLLEAYMQGVPVLASNIPMNADCVLREELLFSPDSPEELAQRIRQSKERSVENTLEILKENRTFVQKSYSEERMVEDYVKILYN